LGEICVSSFIILILSLHKFCKRFGVTVGQKYLVEKTRLGIPALFQSEGFPLASFISICSSSPLGLHGFTNNGTIWPSPIGLSSSFNPELLRQAAVTIADEAEGLGIRYDLEYLQFSGRYLPGVKAISSPLCWICLVNCVGVVWKRILEKTLSCEIIHDMN
jgi:hypothetical protein